jgi:protein-disulfide isomerase
MQGYVNSDMRRSDACGRVLSMNAGAPCRTGPLARGRALVITVVTTVFLITMFALASDTRAEQPNVRSSQATITSAQAEEILSELHKIREILERNAQGLGATPTSSDKVSTDNRASVLIRDDPALGSPGAPLTLIEFADYQCPFCRRFHTTVFDELKKHYIDTGKVRYISRDFPLPMHEHATRAAIAARCAGDQHQFWQFRHVLIVNGEKLKRNDLLQYATDLHLDVAAFSRCLDDKRYEDAVSQDAKDAADIGVVGTPTFVLGKTVPSGRIEGVKIVGAQPYSVYEEKIRKMLTSN